MKSLLMCPLALAGAISCAAGLRGASPEVLAAAQSEHSAGADVYDTYCAECHGERGEGLGRVPPVIGARALPREPPATATTGGSIDPEFAQDSAALDDQQHQLTRVPFVTAQDVFVYMTRRGGHPRLKADLTEEQHLEALSFILEAHGANVPPEGVTRTNASDIHIEND